MVNEQQNRTGQMFVYKDINGATKVTMVGYDVTQEEYDLMPKYVQDLFERPDDRFNEILQDRDPNVYTLPADVVAKVEDLRASINDKETSSKSETEMEESTQE